MHLCGLKGRAGWWMDKLQAGFCRKPSACVATSNFPQCGSCNKGNGKKRCSQKVSKAAYVSFAPEWHFLFFYFLGSAFQCGGKGCSLRARDENCRKTLACWFFLAHSFCGCEQGLIVNKVD